MTHRIEVIKHRVRSNGSDFDEHIGELLRAWREEKPQEATLSRLCKLLRSQRINHTANQLEKQFGRKNNSPDSSGIPVDKPTGETKDEVDVCIEYIGQVNPENFETDEHNPYSSEDGENFCLFSFTNRGEDSSKVDCGCHRCRERNRSGRLYGQKNSLFKKKL